MVRKYITVAPPTQGTWRSNDYVSAFRLVDALFFYGAGGGAVYIHILGDRHKRAQPCLTSHPHHIPITFPISHFPTLYVATITFCDKEYLLYY